jgi:hypothetical protein
MFYIHKTPQLDHAFETLEVSQRPHADPTEQNSWGTVKIFRTSYGYRVYKDINPMEQNQI